ncbi:hypothetical protein pipiens_014664 [Culex pipiens pipiens]|uniref:Uncharacterized protein n=1 Tax=Culex pipiens pipiens TaxID=38569 RepID=A0ABD1CTK5_CULPP
MHLEALGLRSDFIHKFSFSVISNINPALRSIDLSHNLVEDKGATNLAGPIAKISKGLSKLKLSHCGLTSKGVNQLAQSLSQNQNISNSLTFLDLSGNNLKDDITHLYNFLAQPNVIEHLDISKTDTTLESLFGALLRGIRIAQTFLCEKCRTFCSVTEVDYSEEMDKDSDCNMAFSFHLHTKLWIN